MLIYDDVLMYAVELVTKDKFSHSDLSKLESV